MEVLPYIQDRVFRGRCARDEKREVWASAPDEDATHAARRGKACRKCSARSSLTSKAASSRRNGGYLARTLNAPFPNLPGGRAACGAMERRPPAAWKAASWGARSGSKVTRSGGEGAEGSRAKPLTRLIRRTKADWKVSQADFRLGNPRHGATRCRPTLQPSQYGTPCPKLPPY